MPAVIQTLKPRQIYIAGFEVGSPQAFHKCLAAAGAHFHGNFPGSLVLGHRTYDDAAV